jgi:hypothetical protein
MRKRLTRQRIEQIHEEVRAAEPQRSGQRCEARRRAKTLSCGHKDDVPPGLDPTEGDLQSVSSEELCGVHPFYKPEPVKAYQSRFRIALKLGVPSGRTIRAFLWSLLCKLMNRGYVRAR